MLATVLRRDKGNANRHRKKEHFKSKDDWPAVCVAFLLCVAGFHRGDIARLGNVGMKMADSKVLQPHVELLIKLLDELDPRSRTTIDVLNRQVALIRTMLDGK